MYLQKCQLFNNTTITASQGIKCGVHLKIVSHEIPRRFDQKEVKMTLQFKVKIISLTALSAYRVGERKQASQRVKAGLIMNDDGRQGSQQNYPALAQQNDCRTG